jgi:hypothetical protein
MFVACGGLGREAKSRCVLFLCLRGGVQSISFPCPPCLFRVLRVKTLLDCLIAEDAAARRSASRTPSPGQPIDRHSCIAMPRPIAAQPVKTGGTSPCRPSFETASQHQERGRLSLGVPAVRADRRDSDFPPTGQHAVGADTAGLSRKLQMRSPWLLGDLAGAEGCLVQYVLTNFLSRIADAPVRSPRPRAPTFLRCSYRVAGATPHATPAATGLA